ncbi:MAG: hypothetical protein GX957_13845 [Clostridiaceae bacterium]|nr:hypothetical protein [Clostridiaceae bacterium]
MKKIKKIDGFEIPSNSVVKLVSCGYIDKVVFVGIKSDNLGNFRKISRDKMIDLRTGEIIDCKVSDSRKDNIISLKKTISKLRDLINCNFFGANNELFITLTYRENMTDVKRLYKDFDKFYKKLKYRYKDIEFCYISVIEPQERGAWHVHLLLKALNMDKLFIDNDSVVSKLWGHGFTKTKRLEGVDNLGAYLSAYLTDLLDEKGKKKGARLYLYPAGVNIYRCSRNCKRPVVAEVVYNELHGLSDFKTYEVSLGVYDENENCCNIIKKEFYNLRRKI